MLGSRATLITMDSLEQRGVNVCTSKILLYLVYIKVQTEQIAFYAYANPRPITKDWQITQAIQQLIAKAHLLPIVDFS